MATQMRLKVLFRRKSNNKVVSFLKIDYLADLQLETFRHMIFVGLVHLLYESPTFTSFLTLRPGRHICLQTFA